MPRGPPGSLWHLILLAVTGGCEEERATDSDLCSGVFLSTAAAESVRASSGGGGGWTRQWRRRRDPGSAAEEEAGHGGGGGGPGDGGGSEDHQRLWRKRRRTAVVKSLQGSPVSVTMQEAFGCAVENRFFQLQDDDCDPLDLLHQASVEFGQRKKKDVASAAKKKGNKKESQKDRHTIVSSTEVPGPKQAPKPTLQKVIQNENRGAAVRVDKPERRTAFREFRPNIIEKPMEYSIDNFEKEKQVINWVANQRGGLRGRGGRGGFPRNMENEDQRGRREFERQSGSDRSSVRAEDKRGGGGPHNWGSIKDAFRDSATISPSTDSASLTEEEQDVKIPEEVTEDYAQDYAQEMTLDEWKSMMDQSRPKAEFNIRKPESSMPSKALVIHKSKFAYNIKDDDYQYGLRKPVNDITSQLDINFGNLARPSRGGRGRGRVRREEVLPHEVLNVQDFALNPDDPDDFPALC